jgi:hypothetical protein
LGQIVDPGRWDTIGGRRRELEEAGRTERHPQVHLATNAR